MAKARTPQNLNIRTPQNLNRPIQRDAPLLRRGKLVKPGEGVSIWWMGDDRITFAAVSEDTGSEYAFWLDYPPPGTGPPRHVHSREEEGFFLLHGNLELKAGGIHATVSDGTFFAAPRGIPHEWRNIGESNAELITFTTPGGNEGFFLELGEPGDEPPREHGTMPVKEINARTPRYGVTYLESGPDGPDGRERPLPIGEGRGPTLVLPGEGDRRYAAGATYNIKAAGLATADAYTVTEITLEPGGGMPAHRHARYEEAFYVLEGTAAVLVDGEEYEASAGAAVLVPWGVRHRVRNRSDRSVRLFNLTVPGGMEEYYRAACRPSPGPGSDPDGDLNRLRAAGSQLGIEVDTDEVTPD
ncbi:cupin domain-containing protein [Streptomyces sp. NPDC059479]|uniref:cupin domain-containing protein n=1 Tax=Streptomyces sp. NPDC059479 TaxID=3346848 RepID=UPI0036CF4B67